jgi:geranylgeranyl diphosphate synthase type I
VTFSKKKNVNEALPLACALELFHAAFLIHDDIMDGDAVRRGKPSMHAQVGESVALSIGDMAIFCGYDVLSHLGQELVSYISRELANVTVAQMHDVYPREEQTRDALLHTYTYKTARYTFSLPLAAGAILAGAPGETIAQLERLGESMGILFQIRDDELDGDVPSVLEKDLVVIRGKHKKVCMQILDTLEVSAESKQTLLDMLEFVQSRKV